MPVVRYRTQFVLAKSVPKVHSHRSSAKEGGATQGQAMKQIAFWFPIVLVGSWTWFIFGNLPDAASPEAQTMSAAATTVPDLWSAFLLIVWAVAAVMLMVVAMVFRPR